MIACGKYTISITIDGYPLDGSPFPIEVLTHKKIEIVNTIQPEQNITPIEKPVLRAVVKTESPKHEEVKRALPLVNLPSKQAESKVISPRVIEKKPVEKLNQPPTKGEIKPNQSSPRSDITPNPPSQKGEIKPNSPTQKGEMKLSLPSPRGELKPSLPSSMGEKSELKNRPLPIPDIQELKKEDIKKPEPKNRPLPIPDNIQEEIIKPEVKKEDIKKT